MLPQAGISISRPCTRYVDGAKKAGDEEENPGESWSTLEPSVWSGFVVENLLAELVNVCLG